MSGAVVQHGPEDAEWARAIAAASTEAQRIDLAARWILDRFDRFYAESRRVPWLAKAAFERRDHPTTVALSKVRMSLYNISIDTLGLALKQALPRLAADEAAWGEVEALCMAGVAGRYEADLALAYLHSTRRKVHQGEWKPVDYAFEDARFRAQHPASAVYRHFPCTWPVAAGTVAELLRLPDFAVPFRDLAGDADRVAARINRVLEETGGAASLRGIDMVEAGFFRNRGAYVVGRLVLGEDAYRPLIVALLNEPRGIHAEAVLHRTADAHNLFSSTLATFHVTSRHYHELSAFLHSIMRERPLGLHYSTIGFHHVSKVAVMEEVTRELRDNGPLDVAPGFHGTVAIGFTAPGSAYLMKVIRDRPTAGYKWGEFLGVEAVLEKYKWVHDIDRTGSMLDNILYYNLKLDRAWFAPGLLEELQRCAGNALQVQDGAVVFRYLIVQRRLTPLPVFLESASAAEAARAMVNLGYCIKNNAAADIFNKDYDARNYGVSPYLRVYLYDYDALEPLTRVKVRSNLDREDGEEDVPPWFFEDGVVFLPEEIESGLRIHDRALRRHFRHSHGDLMTTDYWRQLQEALLAGQVPAVRTYPEDCDLGPAEAAP